MKRDATTEGSRPRRRAWLGACGAYGWPWALLVFGVALAAYVRTLLPGPVGGDAGELQYAGPLLALVHPTGQPLYVTLGYVWSHLIRFGTVAYRMNLLAACSAAAACAGLTWALHRLYRNPWIALASGVTLAFGSAFWTQAVLADKYAFSALCAALVAGLALCWDRARQGSAGDRWLYALAAAYGLSLLHHRSMFMFAPGLGLMVALNEGSTLWRNPRRTVICLALVLLPALIVYPLFLPWVQARHLSPILWQPGNVGGWLDWWLERHVLADEVLVFDSVGGFGQHLAMYGRTLWNDYTPAVLLVALCGVVAQARRAPASLAFLLLSFVLVGGLAANYRGNERQFTYYLPSFVILLFAYGAGMDGLWRAVRAVMHRAPRGLAVAGMLGIALMLLVPALQFRHTYPLRRSDAIYGAPLGIWRQTLKSGDMGARLAAGMRDLPAQAVILADWEQLTVLWYYQHVEGLRPDLKLVYPLANLADYATGPQEVVLARHLPVGSEWRPTNIGALVHLQRAPAFTPPPGITALGKALYTSEGAPRLELVGYQADERACPNGCHKPLLLTWRALAEGGEDYSISLHILNTAWQQVWAQDIAAPVLGMYPTSRWVPGEVVQDYRELDIPREMAAGRYLWTVVVYRRLADGSFLQLRDAQGNVEVLGGTLDVR